MPIRKSLVKRRVPALFEAKEQVSNLKMMRKFRNFKGVTRHAIAAGTVAGAAMLERNPSFQRGALTIAATAAGVAALSALMKVGDPINRKPIREITMKVGNALTKQAAQDSNLVLVLHKYKYVIVDGEGAIKGTNIPRILGIGRIRLSSQKILNGTY